MLPALQSGQVAAAALDVYETEPVPAEFPLRDMPQLIMTPHLGASTSEAQDNVGIEVAEAISDFLLTGRGPKCSQPAKSGRTHLRNGQTIPESW